MVDRHDFRKIIEDIEKSGTSIYQIAILMHRQYIQIKRIKDTGRCQHHEGEMLLEIHREVVPHETLQIVPTSRTILMQTA